ncbi:MAG: hypothetical protein ACC707_20525 [Thiohalomonadales bacterium]
MSVPVKFFINKSLLIITVLGISIGVAQAAKTQSESGGQLMFDVEPPLIEHTPFTQPQKPNASITIKATITDNLGVQSVSLNYRVKGMQNYRVLSMRLAATNQSLYVGTIPAGQIGSEPLEYYIQATDTGGNTVLRGGLLFPLSIAIIQPPIIEPETVATNTVTTPDTSGLFDLPNNTTTWAWIAGGVIVGGLVAALANKKDDDPPVAKPTGTINITAGLK